MASSTSSNTPTLTHTKDQETNSKTISTKPINRRTPSFSSSSSRSNSWDEDSSSFSLNNDGFSNHNSPTSPFRSFKGIPFSWEQNPGIPKNNRRFKNNKPQINSTNDHLLLPLPPVKLNGNSIQESNSLKKHRSIGKLRKDPFFAALVECSKDDQDDHGNNKVLKDGSKISRSLSDRFGLINVSASCKSLCDDVSDSTVFIPAKPRPHYLLHRR